MPDSSDWTSSGIQCFIRGALVRGVAFGQAELQTCLNQCGTVRDGRTIRIV